MKETGILRKIDRVGRVVIPKKLRGVYQLECGDMVEILTDQECICLKKYDTETNVIDQIEELYETVDRMEKELKETQELKEYLKGVRGKLEQSQNKI